MTVLIEASVLLGLFKYVAIFKRGYKSSVVFILLAALIASSLTYPYLWFVLPAVSADYFIGHVYAEAIIVIVESVVLFAVLRIKYHFAFVASLICNISTIIFGLILNKIVF